jgi:hypothetical protein
MTGISQERAIEQFLNERQEHRAFPDASQTARLLQQFAQKYLSNSVGASLLGKST